MKILATLLIIHLSIQSLSDQNTSIHSSILSCLAILVLLTYLQTALRLPVRFSFLQLNKKFTDCNQFLFQTAVVGGGGYLRG